MPKKLNTSQFIERARLVHGDLYSYEKTVYESAHGKVVIVCPTHGEFEQIAANHLNGSGRMKYQKHKLSRLFPWSLWSL